MMPYEAAKNTIVCKKKPNVVGQPSTAVPPINWLVNLNVTGFAITKNSNAEYKENLNFKPAESAIFYFVC